MSGGRPQLVLLGRSYCHLCEDMRAALDRDFPELSGLVVKDVDLDPELEARFGDLVPVLLLDGAVVCHYHLDSSALRRSLSRRSGEISEIRPAEC